MMFPGTLNSSTLQASPRSLLRAGSVFLLWKIRHSTEGTGAWVLGLGLVLKPRDFNSKLSCKLSCKLNCVASAALRRAQARLA
ncbi:hypothetical protein N333_04000 [Nestor notabilis]|uniref:Uncharacterized protein n=1 Tax=Nestor notabilis TaxID=176057 RepID=A0A091T4S0_NESNO|nr:hypothetical protein N333_04000 [Nestor notabilis]